MRRTMLPALTAAFALHASIIHAETALQRQRAFVETMDSKGFGAVAVSADGALVAYEMRRSPPQGQKVPAAQLWIYDRHTKQSIRTGTECEASMPRWSPRRSVLAFSCVIDGTPSLRTVDVRSGKEKVLVEATPHENATQSLVNFEWDRRGERIAYQISMSQPPEPPKPSPWVDRLLFYTGTTFRTSPPSSVESASLGVVDERTGQQRMLVQKPFKVSANQSLDWSPDGESLLISGEAEHSTPSPDLFVINAVTGKLRALGGTPGVDMGAKYVDESTVVFTAWREDLAMVDFAASIASLQVIDLSSGRLRSLAQEFAGTFEFRDKDAPMWSTGPASLRTPRLVGRKAYFVTLIEQYHRLIELDFDRKRVSVLGPERFDASAYGVSADGSTAALVLSDANEFPEVYVGSPGSKHFERMTDLFADERARLKLSKIEDLSWRSADGKFTVRGFVARPADYDPARRYPLIVNVHGGPGGSYWGQIRDLRDYPGCAEFFTARGYVVLLPNPRGSWSFGEKFMDALRDRLGSVDVDIEAGVDEVIRRGGIDPDRVVIRGHSYGAYAAGWVITQSTRYRAAYLDDGIYDMFSMYGSSYPYYGAWHRHFLRGTPWNNRERYIQDSPVTFASAVKTPTYIRAGPSIESGKRAVIDSPFVAQAQEFYGALKDHGVPVELMVDLLQTHSAVGEQAFENLEREGDWFDFWIRDWEDPDPAKVDQYARWRKLKSDAASFDAHASTLR